jgi:hypothetical protein
MSYGIGELELVPLHVLRDRAKLADTPAVHLKVSLLQDDVRKMVCLRGGPSIMVMPPRHRAEYRIHPWPLAVTCGIIFAPSSYLPDASA